MPNEPSEQNGDESCPITECQLDAKEGKQGSGASRVPNPAGFFSSLILGVLRFGLAYLVGWVRPEGIYWLTTFLILALVSLFGSGLRVAVGARLQKRQPAIGVSLNLAFYLFFLSGGIGVIAFEPGWLQNIAAFVPLTYEIHAPRMAVFYSSADQLGSDAAVLGVSALVTLVLGTLAVRRGLAS